MSNKNIEQKREEIYPQIGMYIFIYTFSDKWAQQEDTPASNSNNISN